MHLWWHFGSKVDSLREAFRCLSPKKEWKLVTKYFLHHHWNGWCWDDSMLWLTIIGSLNSSCSNRVANTLVGTYMPSRWRRICNSEGQADPLESSSKKRLNRMDKLAGSSSEPALASVWLEVQGTYIEAFSCGGSWASKTPFSSFLKGRLNINSSFVCSF